MGCRCKIANVAADPTTLWFGFFVGIVGGFAHVHNDRAFPPKTDRFFGPLRFPQPDSMRSFGRINADGTADYHQQPHP